MSNHTNHTLNLGISVTILILFFIIISIGFVYVDESRKNVEQINGTLTTFIKQWEHKQAIDNVRFNRTLDGLAQTYTQILNLSNLGSQSVQHNLNLTKFNRATLMDTNHKVTEIMNILRNESH